MFKCRDERARLPAGERSLSPQWHSPEAELTCRQQTKLLTGGPLHLRTRTNTDRWTLTISGKNGFRLEGIFLLDFHRRRTFACLDFWERQQTGSVSSVTGWRIKIEDRWCRWRKNIKKPFIVALKELFLEHFIWTDSKRLGGKKPGEERNCMFGSKNWSRSRAGFTQHPDRPLTRFGFSPVKNRQGTLWS